MVYGSRDCLSGRALPRVSSFAGFSDVMPEQKTAYKRDLWPTCNTLLGVTSSKGSGTLAIRVMALCLEEIYIDVENMDSSTDDSEVTCIVPWGPVPLG